MALMAGRRIAGAAVAFAALAVLAPGSPGTAVWRVPIRRPSTGSRARRTSTGVALAHAVSALAEPPSDLSPAESSPGIAAVRAAGWRHVCDAGPGDGERRNGQAEALPADRPAAAACRSLAYRYQRGTACPRSTPRSPPWGRGLACALLALRGLRRRSAVPATCRGRCRWEPCLPGRALASATWWPAGSSPTAGCS